MTTKSDLITKAYSMGKISGITVSASPEEIRLALDRLENMAAEWAENNVCVGYNFEDSPKPSTLHNVPRKYWIAFQSNLMMRLLPDFGKEPSQSLMRTASTSFSRLQTSTAIIPRTDYSSRQPIGSGNQRWDILRKHYYPVDKAPTSCETVKMVIGNIDDFYEDFSSYLVSGEDVSTWVLTADTGLTITNEALYPVSPLDSSRLNYTVEADEDAGATNGAYQVVIVATMSSGRVETRLRNFELITVEID